MSVFQIVGEKNVSFGKDAPNNINCLLSSIQEIVCLFLGVLEKQFVSAFVVKKLFGFRENA